MYRPTGQRWDWSGDDDRKGGVGVTGGTVTDRRILRKKILYTYQRRKFGDQFSIEEILIYYWRDEGREGQGGWSR